MHHVIWLVISIAAFAVGPICFYLAGESKKALKILDYAVIIAVALLVIVGVMPEVIRSLGSISLLLFVGGLLLPTLVESIFSSYVGKAHALLLLLMVVGLTLHTVFDGVGLAFGVMQQHEAYGLLLAIIFHRIPVGLVIWRLFLPNKYYGLLALVSLSVGTFIGYLLGYYLERKLNAHFMTYIEALIAGFLLHVVIHRECEHEHHH